MIECFRHPTKVQYPTKAKARKAAKKLNKPGKGKIEVFPCSSPRHWHIGRPNNPEGKKSGQRIAIEDYLGS